MVGDSAGGAVIEALKEKYSDIQGGRGYGAPIVDVMARSKIKGVLQDVRETRNAQYGDDWKNVPEKLVNNAYQDLVEQALGLDDVKSYKETGIEQVRALGDPIAGFNNSAMTTIPSVSDALQQKH